MHTYSIAPLILLFNIYPYTTYVLYDNLDVPSVSFCFFVNHKVKFLQKFVRSAFILCVQEVVTHRQYVYEFNT